MNQSSQIIYSDIVINFSFMSTQLIQLLDRKQEKPYSLPDLMYNSLI